MTYFCIVFVLNIFYSWLSYTIPSYYNLIITFLMIFNYINKLEDIIMSRTSFSALLAIVASNGIVCKL